MSITLQATGVFAQPSTDGTSYPMPSFTAVLGGLIFVGHTPSLDSGSNPTIADTAGNSWTALTSENNGAIYLYGWYCLSSKAQVGNVITVTSGYGTAGGAVFAHYTTTTGTWAYDKLFYDIGAEDTNGISAASLNTNGAGVVVGYGVELNNWTNASTLSASSPFTNQRTVAAVSGAGGTSPFTIFDSQAPNGGQTGLVATLTASTMNATGYLAMYGASFTCPAATQLMGAICL